MAKEIEITCAWCGKKVHKPLNEINRQRRKGRTNFFCSKSCAAKWHNKTHNTLPIIKKICSVCGKEFETSTAVKKSRTFCSPSCASKGSMTKTRIAACKKGGDFLKKYYPGDVKSAKKLLEKRELNKYEEIREFLDNHCISYEFEYLLEDKLYDLALPDKNILIEFDGAGHGHHSGVYHDNDKLKDQIAKYSGWQLYRIKVQSNSVIPVESIINLIY